MGQRYEKSRKQVSENKKTLEGLHTDKDTLLNEYAPLKLLDSIQELLDDEATDAVQSVRTAGEFESQRIESETVAAEQEKKQIAGEIDGEIAKLRAGLEKLRRAGNIEFGKKAVEQSKQVYKRQIDKLNALMGELGVSAKGSPEGGSAADSPQSFSDYEGTQSYEEQAASADASLISNPFSSGLNAAMKGYPIISGPHSIEDDLKAINPNFSLGESFAWHYNCQRCVSAYEARRRGFDVEALPRAIGEDPLAIMNHPNGWPSVYEGAELLDCSGNSGTQAKLNIESQMEQWGSGARAIVRVRWKETGGGHVFIAERINGTTYFIDPQTGQMNVGEYFNFAMGNGVFCMRIDNLPFTERIRQCCAARAV